jgi:NhaP-type Na+/H+ or K+/H+ antiporter
VLGSLTNWVLLGETLPLAACALIAAIVVPTDADLGQSIFEDPRVPIRVRRILGAESGLNDGVATPFVLLLLAFVIDEESASAHGLLSGATIEIAIAIGAALIGGVFVGWVLRSARRAGWLSDGATPLAMISAAAFSYLLALDLGGNGFIAAYAGGLGYGWITRNELAASAQFAERLGSVLSYVVWTLFGILFVGPELTSFEPSDTETAIAAALIALVVVRPLAAYVATIGSGLLLPTRLVIGWLGPRGLASVVFLLIATDELVVAGLTDIADDVFEIVTWTVLLSVLLHGISAVPIGGRYARWAAAMNDRSPRPLELVDETDAVQATPTPK